MLVQVSFISYSGLVMVIVGEAVRKAGMITAKSAFTHLIKSEVVHFRLLANVPLSKLLLNNPSEAARAFARHFRHLQVRITCAF